ncbi:hypothetical protein A176_000138 [Myxococcus hansupus]|uniref:DUF2231 domain-containing protein n=1 Tax=Pseudomyxococcus hansupus TaxID=1297742 RepID=A0A0H4WIT1_9BACT|nr:DUF2231 domain-containing protein [Myxococcus hansupus]AKQ63226.1 hypothetical protein A176_000138 [Myxococcus hansupus]
MKKAMLLHELHPALVHMPLALLPTAAMADLISVTTGDASWARVARRIWVAGSVSGLFAGVTGLAASQEVRLETPRSQDMTFLHGVGNAAVLAGALGVTAWRLRREPTAATVALGLGACGLALYTATLGGKLVYELGVGQRDTVRKDAPMLLTRDAPLLLVRDALRGAQWLVTRARELLAGGRPLAKGATGTEPSGESLTLPAPVVVFHGRGRPMPQA